MSMILVVQILNSDSLTIRFRRAIGSIEKFDCSPSNFTRRAVFGSAQNNIYQVIRRRKARIGLVYWPKFLGRSVKAANCCRAGKHVHIDRAALAKNQKIELAAVRAARIAAAADC